MDFLLRTNAGIVKQYWDVFAPVFKKVDIWNHMKVSEPFGNMWAPGVGVPRTPSPIVHLTQAQTNNILKDLNPVTRFR